LTDPSAIESPRDVAVIVQFANEELTGWGTPWAGIPVPDTTADVFSGSTFVGHLGVGRGVLETQRAGTFASKLISAKRESQLRQLLVAAQRKRPQ
jgi:hypothetical protein